MSLLLPMTVLIVLVIGPYALWCRFHGTPGPCAGLVHLRSTALTVRQATLVAANVHAAVALLVTLAFGATSHVRNRSASAIQTWTTNDQVG